MSFLTRLFNPARHLALHGHAKRKATSRQLYRQLHDEMFKQQGKPPFPWKDL